MRLQAVLAGLVFWQENALTSGDPLWWRLAVNSSDLSQWCFRNLQLFLDRDCQVNLPNIVEHRSSAALTRILAWDAPTAFVAFASDCTDALCAPLEPWVAVRLEEPSVVQCFKYEDCQTVVDTTTTTSSALATTSTTVATTTTSSTTVQTSSTSNPFANLFEGLGRRLSVPGTLVMERSADFVDWTVVASWNAPQPGIVVSITSSTHTLTPGQIPQGTWQPTADLCQRCWEGGISESSIIEVSFDRKIYFGDGNIEILRGSLPTLRLPARSSPWFKVDASRQRLQVEPQGGALLGSSSACLRIKILDRAILNADGTGYKHDYETCIRDYQPPMFLSSDPVNQETGVDLLPKLQLSFDQVIRLADAPVATLRAKSAPVGGESMPPDQILDLTQATVFKWDRAGIQDAGAIDIYPSELIPQTSYELIILPGVIQDIAGNSWEGGSFLFTTTCGIYGCFQPSTAAPTQDPEPEAQQGDIAIWLIIVGILTIGCAFGVAVFQLYVRKKVNSSAQVHPIEVKDGVGRSTTQASHASVYSEATEAPKVETGPSVHWNDGPSGPIFGDSGPSAANASRPQAHWTKSKEAEDIGNSRKVHEEHGPRQPHTDDHVGFGAGRDQQFKHDKGAPPFNQKVHDRHKEPRGHRTHAQPQPPKKEEPAAPAPLSQNPEVANILQELNGQLESTRKEDIASRKKTFKFSCLKWHPDKNADNLEVATEVFQWLQSQRDWYLKE